MRMVLTTLRAALIHGRSHPREFPNRIRMAVVAIWVFLKTRKASPLAGRRLIACVHCPIYDPKWRACGNGTERSKSGAIVGCLCYMPFKVTLPAATCWLHDVGVTDEGWPHQDDE